MLEQLLNHVAHHQLCKTTDKILLAVSGGVDSMVMLHLFHQAGFNISVAHCNFQLRGADSDADEVFVRKVCKDKSIPVHSTKFLTEAYANENKLSIQVAARKLRYGYFENIRIEYQYDLIATAHHLSDSIETAILNLTRGTGISGLSGIPVKNFCIIRPLLFASRNQILEYARENKITWREDSSNLEDEYQRNFIRHKVIPLLKEINPNLDQTFKESAERISGAALLMQEYLKIFRSKSVQQNDDGEWISRSDLLRHTNPQTLLWELIKPLGFNYGQCCDAVQTIQTGKQFLTATHRLVINRDHFIIVQRGPKEISEVSISEGQQVTMNGIECIVIEKVALSELSLSGDSFQAQVDGSKLSFPLTWRKWIPGDVFKPLGMNGYKKISDFLIDNKVPTFQKDVVTVVESAGKIVWVVGHRISDEFKITSKTSSILSLRVSKTDS